MDSKSALCRCVISNISNEATEAILQLVQVFCPLNVSFDAKEQKNAENTIFNYFNRHFNEVEFT